MYIMLICYKYCLNFNMHSVKICYIIIIVQISLLKTIPNYYIRYSYNKKAQKNDLIKTANVNIPLTRPSRDHGIQDGGWQNI